MSHGLSRRAAPGSVPHSTSRRRYLKAAAGASMAPALSGCEWWFGTERDDGEPAPDAYANTIADARRAIREAMEQSSTSSVSVAMIDGHTIVWQEAFGVIDRETATPAGNATRYNIGSCSKVVTAAAAMILVDRGQLNLDTPITRYLPTFRMRDPAYTGITLRMLLNHASGLPGTSVRNIFLFRHLPGYAESVEATLANLDLKASPGAFSVYCNDGFTLVQQIVAAVSGRTFPDFVTDEIFGPLGMSHSSYPLEPLAEGTFAHSYVGGERRGQEFVLAYGTGGVISTPGDMLRLASMFLHEGEYEGRRILSASAVNEMARNQTVGQPLYPYPQFPYGLGWDSVAQAGMAAVGIDCWQKNGGTACYGSNFFVLPRERLALMITGSSTQYGAGALAERILLNALVERRSIARMPPPVGPGDRPAPADEADLARMVGVYGSHDALYRVERDGTQALLIRTWQEGQWVMLVRNLQRRSEGLYAVPSDPVRAWGLSTVGGIDFLLSRVPAGYGHYSRTVPTAQLLAPRAELPAAWRLRLGRRWLLVNEDWSSVSLALGEPGFTLEAAPELPGYVLIDGHQAAIPETADRTRMTLTIPVVFGRDLLTIVVVRRGAEEWLQVDGQWFRPMATVPGLGQGSTVVGIGNEGYIEWRRLSAGGRLRLQGAPQAWKLYDASLRLKHAGQGDGEAPGESGDYLAVFGPPGAVATVVLG
ncbi:MAG: beta-lactamase family protein [Pigmentiphaga sp.]|nr:beta-lactamase family protein [Pigmentiphaga sp.]